MTKSFKPDAMIEWIRKNKKSLSIRGIEEQLGMKDTLRKAVEGTQQLPKKWIQPLTDFIIELQKPFK